jgi:hypothetical protein
MMAWCEERFKALAGKAADAAAGCDFGEPSGIRLY